MRKLDMDYLELYKRVDQFIKDLYKSEEGVSEYVRQMKAYDLEGATMVTAWTDDYKTIKRLRRVRNKIVHEVDSDFDGCTDEDYDNLQDFYDCLFNIVDPLAVLDKELKEEENIRNIIRKEEKRQEKKEKQIAHSYQFERKHLWQRIKDFFMGY